jgi:3-phosphoshikimate 1-carboxyvinyltransferase
MAALLDPSLQLNDLPLATDVTNLIDCLKGIGLKIQMSGSALKFLNSFPACEDLSPRVINVGEGGTTARFLATMLLLGKSHYTLILGERLKDRPWDEFLELARKLGAEASLSGNQLTIKGPAFIPERLEIDCTKTTQFASGFQLLSVRTGTEVIPVSMESSQSYWKMTEKMVRELKTLSHYDIPLDWSSASYPLAFAALNHEVEFPGLHFDPYQADAKFLRILESFGCVNMTENGIKIIPLLQHQDVHFDVSDCLDLVPTLGYFLSHVEGTHQLTGVQNLVHKESDRLSEVLKLITTFGRDAHSDGKTLTIRGAKERSHQKADLHLPDDHRMVMAGALFLLHHNGGRLAPSEAVNKSYPDFFNLISRI